jgi:hypothetical protein
MVTEGSFSQLLATLEGQSLPVRVAGKLERFFHSQAADDGQNRIEALELKGVQYHLAKTRVQRQLNQVRPEFGQIFPLVHRTKILGKRTRVTISGGFSVDWYQKRKKKKRTTKNNLKMKKRETMEDSRWKRKRRIQP